MPTRDPLATAETELRTFALAYPEAVEDFPWGERAIKVKGKIFLFMRLADGVLTAGMKLPVSNATALAQPFAEPTGYGLGKHGWITAKFPAGTAVPVELLKEWVDESYRAVAPKKVLAALDAPAADDWPTSNEHARATKPGRGKKRGS